jgi:hypothetical protein
MHGHTGVSGLLMAIPVGVAEADIEVVQEAEEIQVNIEALVKAQEAIIDLSSSDKAIMG